MSRKPRLALTVRDLPRSIAFYEKIGWEVVSEFDPGNVVEMRLEDGTMAIVTMNPNVNLEQWMDKDFDRPRPGQRVYLSTTDAETLRNRCDNQGIPIQSFEVEDFWNAVIISDEDGYLLSFYQHKDVSDEQILSAYEKGPQLLLDALRGLTEEELDLVRAPGKWSIRQTALHLIDSDITSAITMKFALAEPGRFFERSAYSPDKWVEGCDYANRPIHVEVELFRVIREHILGLCRHLPDAFNRTVERESGPVSVRFLVKLLAGHAKGHINQILETRHVHGI